MDSDLSRVKAKMLIASSFALTENKDGTIAPGLRPVLSQTACRRTGVAVGKNQNSSPTLG